MSAPLSSSLFLHQSKLSGLARKKLRPVDIVLGGIWLGPGSGPKGNGTHPDLGQDNANAVVQCALEAGIVEFDTAPWYGAGAAEERLGRAIRELGVQNQVKIGTKVGRIFWDRDGITPATGSFKDDIASLSNRICRNDYTAQGAKMSLEHSLRRMGLDRVDILRIHDPNDNSINNRRFSSSSSDFVDEVAQALEAAGMVEELRAMRDDRGEIQHIGIGMNTNIEPHMGSPQDVLRMLRGAPPNTFDSALLAGGWNLLCQSGWECLQACQTLGVHVYAAGIFASGFLADDTKAYAYQHSVPVELLRQKRQWLDLVKQRYSLAAVAIGFAALPTAVTRLVIGVATPEELYQLLEWVEESNNIEESLWEEAYAHGLWHVES